MKTMLGLNEFELDIARSVILSRLISEWGAPVSRKIFAFESVKLAEIYVFETDGLVRLCSIGGYRLKSAKELLCVFDSRDEKYNLALAIRIISDALQYMFNSDEVIVLPRVVKFHVSDIEQRLLLFDEARGESESVSLINLNGIEVEIVWVVELKKSEFNFINEKGMERFDRKVDEGVINLLKISR